LLLAAHKALVRSDGLEALVQLDQLDRVDWRGQFRSQSALMRVEAFVHADRLTKACALRDRLRPTMQEDSAFRRVSEIVDAAVKARQ
jgi:hypothetical protein